MMPFRRGEGQDRTEYARKYYWQTVERRRALARQYKRNKKAKK